MIMDLHADQIQGFFDIPVDHVYVSRILINYIKKLNIDKLTMCFVPDSPEFKTSSKFESGAL
jgi:phosphoribosylpyrophosphate synthetase